ncbi:MAG: arsenic efflux protein [Clostridiales bacterium]|nr:arsenic efflux protein [Clostridiales bacterium]
MGEVFLYAFIDTLNVLPFLLIMNFLIELIEYRSQGLKADKMLKGGGAPLLGTAVGILPQCGFSVVATELYSKRRIALGTLLAVYLATSDEALPIMLSSYESGGPAKLLPVLIIKLCFALIVGYAAFGIERLSRRNTRISGEHAEKEGITEHNREDDGCAHEHTSEEVAENAHDDDDCTSVHIHGCHNHALEETVTLSENATGKQRAAYIWNVFLKHPIIHSLTVIAYILAVNIVFGIIIYYVGERRLADFIGSTGYLQPLLAGLVGFIPNCAASVVITELYLVGALNLGGTIAGLCMSAGIGYAVLVKQNRPVKDTVVVILSMYVLSVALGLAVTAVSPHISVLNL